MLIPRAFSAASSVNFSFLSKASASVLRVRAAAAVASAVARRACREIREGLVGEMVRPWERASRAEGRWERERRARVER